MKDMQSKESSPVGRTLPRDLPFGLHQEKPHEWSYLSHLEFTPQHHVPLMMDLEFQIHACPPGFAFVWVSFLFVPISLLFWNENVSSMSLYFGSK